MSCGLIEACFAIFVFGPFYNFYYSANGLGLSRDFFGKFLNKGGRLIGDEAWALGETGVVRIEVVGYNGE